MQKLRKIFIDYLLISAGALLFAVGLSLFAEPFHIAPGGVSGIAIIINYLSGLPVGLTIILINIPLFLVGFLKLGRPFVISSFYAMMLSSVLVDLLAQLKPFVEEPLLAALYGGLFIGAGMGLIFIHGASTGGSDIVVRLLRLRFVGLKLGRIMFLTDLAVIALAALVFGDLNRSLYAIITVYINSIVVDAIIYGLEFSKVAYVISPKSELIVQRIQDELERGVTLFFGAGAYTNKPFKIIMCALSQQQIVKFYSIVQEADPDAFVIVTNAHEVVGYGFKKTGLSDL
ncbi:MAG: YitT family protein [Clostridiales bacterium]|nr:YitT family protein [Clostridiales bacterium]